jgi:hypothetical protein
MRPGELITGSKASRHLPIGSQVKYGPDNAVVWQKITNAGDDSEWVQVGKFTMGWGIEPNHKWILVRIGTEDVQQFLDPLYRDDS